MPPQKAVASLRDMTHDSVMRMVCAIILQDLDSPEENQWESLDHPVLSASLQTARDVMSSVLVPPVLHDILNSILQGDERVEVAVRFSALQLLLVPGVTRLVVGHFPEAYYCLVLSAIANSAAELRFLDLRGVWVKESHKFHLYKALRRMHTLKHLTVRYSCDDEMLRIVGKHCPKLERLDISGSDDFTENGVKSLFQKTIKDQYLGCNDLANTLKIVDLGGPNAQKLAVSKASLLLRYLPNLTSLGGYERTGAAVEAVHNEDPKLVFKLIFIHDLYTSLNRITIMSKFCPKLRSLYLDCPKGTAVQNIDMVKSLVELKLHKARSSDVEISLRNMKRRLRSLHLSYLWGAIDLAVLASHCPNLSRLELHGLIINNTAYSENSSIRSLRVFPQLVELIVYRSVLHLPIVKSFLFCSEVLEHIAFGEYNKVTDDEMVTIIKQSSLNNLKELWFGEAMDLSFNSLTALMENCPLVTSIGNMAGWAVSSGETSLIRSQLTLTNTDLTLHEYGAETELIEDAPGRGFVIIFGIPNADFEENEE